MRVRPRTPRLDTRLLGRAGALAGPLAGLVGGVLSGPAVALRALLSGASLAEPFRARAFVLVGSESAGLGLLLHLAWAAALGAIFGMVMRLGSGMESVLRGLAFTVAIWLALRFVGVPLLAPDLPAHAGFGLLEALILGAALGSRAPLARVLLRRQLGRPVARA